MGIGVVREDCSNPYFFAQQKMVEFRSGQFPSFDSDREESQRRLRRMRAARYDAQTVGGTGST